MNIFCVLLLLASVMTISIQQEVTDPDPQEPGEEGDIETTTYTSEDSDEDGLPSDDIETVAFYLYPDTENLTYHEEIRLYDNDSLIESNYSPMKQTLFIIHGFVNNYTTRYSQRVKDAFLENGYTEQYNVIVVDWGALATPKNQTNLGVTPLTDLGANPHYQRAVKNVPRVGKRISEFIDFLMSEYYLASPEDVYLLGFSLGAQVSGTAGYEVKQNTSMAIGRITGLDPAGPLYNGQSNLALKLDATDAEFVDIIHTNQGQSGYEGNTGHADFYPNGGGPNQNDCLSVGVGVIGEYGMGVCAHNRAWVYYLKTLTEEIYACKCLATPDYWCRAMCQNKTLFGYPCPPTARGTFYVDITAKGE